MEQRIISQFYCFVLVLLFGFCLSSSYMLQPREFRKHYVRIVNNLNNKPLNYHCKSGDDDLGLKTPQFKEEWEFSFHLNIQDIMLFYCYFSYENFHAAFVALNGDPDQRLDCGGDHCIWTAQEDGFYLYQIKHNQNVKQYD
nr:S-protein homolog 5-like [Quercus suber]